MRNEMEQPVELITDKPLYARAYDAIKEAILSGRFQPDQRLNQTELSEQLGVSRAPVLDALARLTSQGLVDHRPRRGYFVKVLSTKDVADLYNVRAILECQAFEELCEHVTPAQIDALRRTLQVAEGDLERGNLEPYIVADENFHTTLVEFSGNRVIEELMAPLRDRVQLVRVMVAVSADRVRRAAREHQELLRCLENRDVARGREVMWHHIDTVKVEVVNKLKSMEPTT